MSDLVPLPILRSVQDVREWRSTLSDPSSIGFVPTMGALHDGHLQLIRHSLSSQNHTIVSIFVNPAQFSPTEDLSNYPSTLDADLGKLNSLNILPGDYQIPHDGFDGKIFSNATTSSTLNDPITFQESAVVNKQELRRVSAVFLPTNDVLYPSGIVADRNSQRGAFVTVHGLSEQLEGARRPGFFRGVATVVLKLFMIVEPTIAFFGQKDLQQCLLIRQLCKDFHIIRPKSIVAIPTVRDSSTGLAMSSRHSYLSPDEIKAAKILYSFLLQSAQRLLSDNLSASIKELSESFRTSIPSISLDFISVNDPITFDQISENQKIHSNLPIVISGAILIKCNTGQVVRLIDNIVINYDLNHSI